jgi:hypothetical protein
MAERGQGDKARIAMESLDGVSVSEGSKMDMLANAPSRYKWPRLKSLDSHGIEMPWLTLPEVL